MLDPTILSRIQFFVTIGFHFIFPPLSMGLILYIIYFKIKAYKYNNEVYKKLAKFWLKIFTITFLFGSVTGITMEFQFGTNWGEFSRIAGKVVGQMLAMEGIIAFALESVLIGILLFGEKRIKPIYHIYIAILLFLAMWISAFFIISVNAWMQHPVGYAIAKDGTYYIKNIKEVLTNFWIWGQYIHTQSAAIIYSSFMVMSVGAFYLLKKTNIDYGKIMLKSGFFVALIFTLFQIFPSGDSEARKVFKYQPIKGASMEGVFKTTHHAPEYLFGIIHPEEQKITNGIYIPDMLSMMVGKRFHFNKVQGLEDFPKELWPKVPIVFYSFRLMTSLAFFFTGIMFLIGFMLWKKKLFTANWLLRILVLIVPLPYFAILSGWIVAEAGRQPWIIYFLLKTKDGVSKTLTHNQSMFGLVGYISLYILVGILFLIVTNRVIVKSKELN